ncbi:hypothetical protein [Streptomyces sp. NPDC001816]|uniref:DUF7878 domain-containing protein n=1 Tax=Streptomyces sp. NPDC001816 TaxID=3364612 RepID=UPI00367478BC
MAVKFAYENLAAQDLDRRGLRPETAPTALLLVDIEADLTIRDEDRVVMAEGLFPVAELARSLVGWLRRPVRGCRPFPLPDGTVRRFRRCRRC